MAWFDVTIFLKIKKIQSVKRLRYRHLIDFTADYNAPPFMSQNPGSGLLDNFTVFCPFAGSYLKCVICLAMDYHATFLYRDIDLNSRFDPR